MDELVTEAPLTPTSDDYKSFKTFVQKEEVVHIIISNDHNCGYGLEVSRILNDAMNCYMELYKQRMQWEQQQILDVILLSSVLQYV